jgi:hypothetical protein
MTASNHPTELLAALALDAVGPGDEREDAERHVRICPRCRQELDAMRVISSSLGHVIAAPPDGLWTAISSRLGDRTAPSTAVPALALPFHTPPAPRRRHRRPGRALAAACATAVVVIGLLAVGLVASNDRVARLQGALGNPGRAAVAAALVAPGHRDVVLRGRGGVQLATFVLLPSGTGYLVDSDLSPAAPGRTYELWAAVGGSPLPVALLGATPSDGAFTVASSPRPTALLLTVEPAAGSLRPTSEPVGEAIL